jgi:hypothetical protein
MIAGRDFVRLNMQSQGEIMLHTLEEAFRLAAELECGLRRHISDPAKLLPPRDADEIMRYFKSYLGGCVEFRLRERDFSDTKGMSEALARRRPTQGALRSFIVNKIDTRGYCRVLLNAPMMNTCWRRFCKVKETSQAVIRRFSFVQEERVAPRDDEWEIPKEYLCDEVESSQNETPRDEYVDTATIESAARLLKINAEKEIALDEFERPELSSDGRIEKTGEIIAALLLFPPTEMIAARNRLLDEIGSIDGSLNQLDYANFYDIADKWKVPTKCVQSFLTHEGLEYNCQVYEMVLRARGF